MRQAGGGSRSRGTHQGCSARRTCACSGLRRRVTAARSSCSEMAPSLSRSMALNCSCSCCTSEGSRCLASSCGGWGGWVPGAARLSGAARERPLVGWWAGGLVGWWAGGLVGWWAGGLVGWWAGGLAERPARPADAGSTSSALGVPRQRPALPRRPTCSAFFFRRLVDVNARMRCSMSPRSGSLGAAPASQGCARISAAVARRAGSLTCGGGATGRSLGVR